MLIKYFFDRTMTSPSLDNPEEISTYLKENMAEGHLSEDEGLNIDKFVDRYEELMKLKDKTQEIIREIQEGQVQ